MGVGVKIQQQPPLLPHPVCRIRMCKLRDAGMQSFPATWGEGGGGRYKKNNGECYSVGMSFKGTVSKEKYGVFIMEGIALGVTFLQSSVKRATIF